MIFEMSLIGFWGICIAFVGLFCMIAWYIAWDNKHRWHRERFRREKEEKEKGTDVGHDSIG